MARHLLAHGTELAPNVASAVLDSFTRSPLDTERNLPNMAGGDLLVGSFANGQVGAHRPFPGASHYRTPLPGLYLCGGSTHPGGNVTGLCGYNPACVIAADAGKTVWWSPPEIEASLNALPSWRRLGRSTSETGRDPICGLHNQSVTASSAALPRPHFHVS